MLIRAEKRSAFRLSQIEAAVTAGNLTRAPIFAAQITFRQQGMSVYGKPVKIHFSAPA